MITPIRLKVEGFRGFRDPEEFLFDAPVTDLFGDNRSCKSSTLNAVEWGLYGAACAGKDTGIRERVGWVFPNAHMPTTDIRVEVELDGPGGTYLVCRSLRAARRKTPEERLELTLPDSSVVAGVEAEERLAGLLQSSFRDFLTTAYQHQESIRDVLTQTPKERNDAIDRLLGLSAPQNLIGALAGANLRARQKEVSRQFADFEQQVQTALRARESDLAGLLQQAQDAGLSRKQLTLRTALQTAQTVTDGLAQFAAESELKMPALDVPTERAGLAEFDRAALRAINGLRGQVPGIEEQKTLLRRQKELLIAQTALESVNRRWTELGPQVRALDVEHGGRKGVEAKIADASEKLEAQQERLRQTSGQAAVVSEALQYLEGIDAEEPSCPVCGTEVAGLRDKVRRLWEEKLQALGERIKKRIDELKQRLKQLRTVLGQYQQLDKLGEAIQEELVRLRTQTGTLLDQALEKDDDALAEVKAELKRLDRRLRQLADAIQERQDRLNAFTPDLERVGLIREYLRLEARRQTLETIQESDAFRQLEALRDRIAELVEDAEAIKDAVAAVSREQAEARLDAAGQTIDEYFRELSHNPAVQHLKLAITTDKRTHRNAYDITDQEGKDLTPLLSQGDLNALALAIFLGLATAAQDRSPFGFLMLDDPSQSLGSAHKKHLAQLLDRVARQRKLIVATMDAEFQQCLTENLTKAKRVYRFGKWTPAKGPSVSADRPDREVGGGDGRG